MSRLRIQVETIVSDGFDLELPRDGGESDRVVLARVVKLHGSYEQDTRQIRLRRVAADALGIAQLAWHWEGGHVALPSHGDLEGVVLDLAIAKVARRSGRPLTGTVTVKSAQLGSLAVRHGDLLLGGAVALTGLEAHEPADASAATAVVAAVAASNLQLEVGATGVVATSLEARGMNVSRDGSLLDVTLSQLHGVALRLRSGDHQLSIDSVAARDVRIHRGPSGLDIEMGAAELRGVELGVGAAKVRLDHLALPAGLRWSGGELTLPALTLDVGHVEVQLGGDGTTAAQPSVSPRRRERPIDLRFLDHLAGRIDVDATVDARVPFIKRRLATHHFRVPIEDGTLDFKELENDLSMLEDALLDFEVRRGKLVLEVKPPILRFAKKTLVEWALEPDQVALAAKNRVHLRTLAAPQVPSGRDKAPAGRDEAPAGRDEAEESSFELTRLELDPIDAELRLAGPAALALGDHGTVHLGAAGEAALGALRVTGAVHHHARGVAAGTELQISARAVRIGLDRLHLAGWVTSADAISLAALDEGVVTLAGVHPTATRGVLRGLELRGLRVARAEVGQAR